MHLFDVGFLYLHKAIHNHQSKRHVPTPHHYPAIKKLLPATKL